MCLSYDQQKEIYVNKLEIKLKEVFDNVIKIQNYNDNDNSISCFFTSAKWCIDFVCWNNNQSKKFFISSYFVIKNKTLKFRKTNQTTTKPKKSINKYKFLERNSISANELKKSNYYFVLCSNKQVDFDENHGFSEHIILINDDFFNKQKLLNFFKF